MKILIVDDDINNIKLLTKILERKYEVITASNGLDGIQQAKEERPDLVILDLMMSGMNGYEVLEKLTGQGLMDEMFVIFLTAHYIDINQVVKGLEMGAFDYITKPFEELILRAKIGVVSRVKEAEMNVKKQNVELETKVEKLTSSQKALLKINEALNHKNSELEDQNSELGRFNRLLVNRELKLKEFKQRINELERLRSE